AARAGMMLFTLVSLSLARSGRKGQVLGSVLKSVSHSHMETNEPPVPGRGPPRAPVRAMQAIGALAQTRAAVSLATLGAQLELPKTSLMHLLRALEAAGYVRRMDGGYKLAGASFRLAAAIGSANAFEDVAADVLPSP